MITEALIKAAWNSYKSIDALAKQFGVKPAEVREAFDIALARQPKTTEAELAARRELYRTRTHKSNSQNREKRREYEHCYYQANRVKILERQRKQRQQKKEAAQNG